MHRTLVLLFATAFVASGCYAYIPAAPGEVSPGQEVRLRLTPEEAGRYEDIRRDNPRVLEGTFVEAIDGSFNIETSIGVSDPTRGTRVLRQQLSVTNSGILEVELKELDKMRTGLAVGGGAALLAVAIAKSVAGSGSEGPGGGQVEEARRIPVLRFVLPFGRR